MFDFSFYTFTFLKATNSLSANPESLWNPAGRSLVFFFLSIDETPAGEIDPACVQWGSAIDFN